MSDEALDVIERHVKAMQQQMANGNMKAAHGEADAILTKIQAIRDKNTPPAFPESSVEEADDAEG